MVQPLAPIGILAPVEVSLHKLEIGRFTIPAISLATAESVELAPVVFEGVPRSLVIDTPSLVVLDKPSTGQFNVSAIEINVEASVQLDPAVGTFAEPPISVSVGADVTLAPVTAQLSAVEVGLGAVASANLDPATATLTVVEVGLGGGGIFVSLTPVVVTPVGVEVSLAGAVAVTLTPATAAFEVDDPSLATGTIVTLDPATLTLSGQNIGVAAAASVVIDSTEANLLVEAPALGTGTTITLQPVEARLDASDLSIGAGDVVQLTAAQVNLAVVAPSIGLATSITLGSAVVQAIVGPMQVNGVDITLAPVVAELIARSFGPMTQVELTPVVFKSRFSNPSLMGVYSLRDIIYCALVESSRSGPFYRVLYNADTGKSTTGTQTEPKLVSILGNETESEFDTARLHRRRFRDERQRWVWLLILEFNEEVTLEHFEEWWAANPRIIKPRSGPKVFLRLERADYDHPVQHQENKGTEARLTFRADLAPV